MACWFGGQIGYRTRKRRWFMVALTERAVSKVKEIIEAQAPRPAGLRIAVVGGGCSGFSYAMTFENNPGMLDKTYNSDRLKVFFDQPTPHYLHCVQSDFIDT